MAVFSCDCQVAHEVEHTVAPQQLLLLACYLREFGRWTMRCGIFATATGRLYCLRTSSKVCPTCRPGPRCSGLRITCSHVYLLPPPFRPPQPDIMHPTGTSAAHAAHNSAHQSPCSHNSCSHSSARYSKSTAQQLLPDVCTVRGIVPSLGLSLVSEAHDEGKQYLQQRQSRPAVVTLIHSKRSETCGRMHAATAAALLHQLNEA